MRALTLFLIFFSMGAFGAPELPLTFTVSGRLFDSPTSSDPLLDHNVELRVQILDSLKSCILYDERRIISTDTSEGAYSFQVGGGTRVSGSDVGNSMEAIFQNAVAITGKCPAPAVSAPPVLGSGRYMRLMVKPSAASTFETLTPEIFLGSLPSALVAETLGGLTKDQFLKPGSTGNLNQANLENLFSSSNYPTLTSLLSGSTPSTGGSSPSSYVITADNGDNHTGSIRFMTGYTVKAEITNAGDFIAHQKIGIGTGATAPTTDLAFGGAADRMIGVERNPTAGSDGKKLIVEAGGATVASSNKNGGDLYLSSGTATGTGSSQILFDTVAPGASGSGDRNPTTKMVLDGLGHLGVGTTTPDGPLDITADVNGNSRSYFRNMNLGSSRRQDVAIGTGTSNSEFIYVGVDMGGGMPTQAYFDNYSGGDLGFYNSSDEAMRISHSGKVGIGGVTNPTARLHLRAGTAGAQTAPLKFTSGPLLTSPEDGAMEFLTNTLYFTAGGVRYTIPFAAATGDYNNVTSISNSSGNISVTPQAGAGSLIVNGAVSTSSSSGALIVSGGVGVSQNLNVAGIVSSAINYSPQLYGSSTAAGNLHLDGTDHVTKGNVLLSTAGGRVGIGTISPSFPLDVSASGSPADIVDVARFFADAASTAMARITFGTFGSGGTSAAIGAHTKTGTQGALVFYTNDSGLNERMRIDANGNVGVGTTTPDSRLEVNLAGAGNPRWNFSSASDNPLLSAYRSTGVGSSYYGYQIEGGVQKLSIKTAVGANLGTHSFVDRLVIDASGGTGVGVSSPTAALHLKAGSASGNTAPLKFTSGPLLTTPEDGAMEFLTNALYFTAGGVRYTIPFSTSGGAYTNVSSISNSSGNISVSPQGGAGSLTVQGATSSSTTTGALIVNGGVGVSQNLNVGGSVSAVTNYVPQIYGSTSASGNIRIDGTNHANKGHVLLATAGGRVGVGTTTPTAKLDVATSGDPTDVTTGLKILVGQDLSTATTSQKGLDVEVLGGLYASEHIGVHSKAFNVYNSGLKAFFGESSSNGNSYTSAFSLYGKSTNTYANYGTQAYAVYGEGVGPTTGDTVVGGQGVWGGYFKSSGSGNQYGVYADAFLTGTPVAGAQAVPLVVATNGSELMRVQANGNMGVGTITPRAKIDVVGGGIGISGWSNNNSGTAGGLELGWNGSSSVIQSYNRQGSAYTPQLYSASSHNFVNGNVEVGGASTTSPQIGLNATGNHLRMGSNAGDANHSVGWIGFNTTVWGAGSGGHVGVTPALIDTTKAGWSIIGVSDNSQYEYQGFLSMRYTSAAGVTSTPFSISSTTGNIGLGTTSPVDTLHLQSSATTYTGLRITNADTGGRTWGMNSTGSASTSGPGNFGIYDWTANGYRLLVNPSGDVAIGHTSPTQKLDVNGNIFVRGGRLYLDRVSGSDEYSYITPSTPYHAGLVLQTTFAGTASNRMIIDREGRFDFNGKMRILDNGNVGIANTNPGYPLDIVGSVRATDYLFSSDRRLKRDILPIAKPLESLKKLQGVQFTWKESGNRSLGFIAQEVEKVFPELVKTDASGMKSVQYSNIVSVAIEAMKEYFEQNDKDKAELRLRLIASEREVNDLKLVLQRMNSRLEKLEKSGKK